MIYFTPLVNDYRTTLEECDGIDSDVGMIAEALETDPLEPRV